MKYNISWRRGNVYAIEFIFNYSIWNFILKLLEYKGDSYEKK